MVCLARLVAYWGVVVDDMSRERESVCGGAGGTIAVQLDSTSPPISTLSACHRVPIPGEKNMSSNWDRVGSGYLRGESWEAGRGA